MPTAETERGDQQFCTAHLDADLKRRSVRGGAVTLSSQLARFVLQMASTAVLGRLLLPADFGLVAMVAAFTGFVGLFKDLGLTAATVQRPAITHEQVSTVFWVNVSISTLLALVGFAIAPMVVAFYGEPRLAPIVCITAGTFVFGGLTAQHTALLRRQMRFGSLAVIDLSSLLTSLLVAIIFAACGAGYWSLVAMGAAQSSTNMVGSWLASGWRPSLPTRNVQGIRAMLSFGGHLTAFSALNYFARNADNAMIGWRWGASSLGLYSKAYGLLMMPIQQINAPIGAVAVPTLSRLQDNPERFRHYYCTAVQIVAYLTMPLMSACAVLSPDIIRLVLGRQWEPASPIFTALAIAGLIQPVSNTVGWIYISLNRTKRMMYWGVISSSLYVVGFAMGLPWGPLGVAISWTICVYLMWPALLWYAFRGTPVRVQDVLLRIRWPLALAGLQAAAMIAVSSCLSESNTVVRAAVVTATGFLADAAMLSLFRTLRVEVIQLYSHVASLRSR